MRHLQRTINLSQYKSFVNSPILAYRDGVVVDMSQVNNQIKFNAKSNYGLFPVMHEVKINEFDIVLYWSWPTLHAFYRFAKTHDVICQDDIEYERFADMLKLSFEIFVSRYEDIQKAVVSFVENGISQSDFIAFTPCDLATEPNPCVEEELEKSNIALSLFIGQRIDDLGLMTNLIDDWQPHTSYTKRQLVQYDNKDWQLAKGSGFTWVDEYKESLFGNIEWDETKQQYCEKSDSDKQWIRNIDYDYEKYGLIAMPSGYSRYTDGIENLSGLSAFGGYKPLVSRELYYAYKDDRFIYMPTPVLMADSYELTMPNAQFVFIGHELYTEQTYHYVDYFDCLKNRLYVKFQCGKPYLDYNGKRIFGYQDTATDGKEFYTFEYNGLLYNTKSVTGVMFNGGVQPIVDGVLSLGERFSKYSAISADYGYVVLNGIEYIFNTKSSNPSAFTYLEYNNVFVLQETSVLGTYLSYDDIDGSSNSSLQGFSIHNGSLLLFSPYDVRCLNYISGETETHIGDFRNDSVLYDNLGSHVNGLFIPYGNDLTKYVGSLRPLPYDSLSLQYSIGSTRHLEKLRENLFFGDILHNIEFLVRTDSGNYIPFKGLTFTSTGHALHQIFADYTLTYDKRSGRLISIVRRMGDAMYMEDALSWLGCTLVAKMEYCIGAFIKYADGKYVLAPNKHHGVEYTDYFTVQRNIFVYGRSKNDRYPIYYYTLTGENFNAVETSGESTTKSYFKMEIPVFMAQDNSAVLVNDSHFDDEGLEKLEKYRNFISVPTVRREYNLGMAYQEKVSEDIYIDRGISTAFEKHLKLQEIATMQDLENYSNGGFFSISE